MKCLLVLIALGCHSYSGFSQANLYPSSSERLMRSRHLLTTGWILTTTGSVVTIAGTAVLINSLSTNFTGNYKSQSALGGVLIGAGVLTIAGGIPFFIQAHHTHKRALLLSAVNNTLPPIVHVGRGLSVYPALRLQFTL